MICVAVNNKNSFLQIEKWRHEIEEAEYAQKPIMLILTKSDKEKT